MAFKPPLALLPSFLCHAGVLAICDFQFIPVDAVEQRLNGILVEVTCERIRAYVWQADLHINVDFETFSTDTVTEKVILTNVLAVDDLEVKHCTHLLPSDRILIHPLRMVLNQRLNHMTLNHHEPCTNALYAHQ